MKTTTLDEQLESFRRHLETQLSLEKGRLDQWLQEKAAANITEITSRAEESIKKAVEHYEKDMAKADAKAQDPSLSFLAESMRKSAKRQMEITIDAHKAIADRAISSIRKLVR